MWAGEAAAAGAGAPRRLGFVGGGSVIGSGRYGGPDIDRTIGVVGARAGLFLGAVVFHRSLSGDGEDQGLGLSWLRWRVGYLYGLGLVVGRLGVVGVVPPRRRLGVGALRLAQRRADCRVGGSGKALGCQMQTQRFQVSPALRDGQGPVGELAGAGGDRGESDARCTSQHLAQSFLHGSRELVTDEDDVGCPAVGAIVTPASLMGVGEPFLDQQVRGLLGVGFELIDQLVDVVQMTGTVDAQGGRQLGARADQGDGQVVSPGGGGELEGQGGQDPCCLIR